MTIKEAKEQLEDLREFFIEENVGDEDVEALRIAIKILEKHLKKKK